MSAKPEIPLKLLRRAVRQVCNMSAGHPKSEDVLKMYVQELLESEVTDEQLRAAIEWNHSEGYIRQEKDGESEEIIWFITAHGQAKERIS